MMHHNATNAARPPSLIDTVGAGFRALNQNLPVLIIPIVLNLWYWIGPRVSLRLLGERIRAFNPVAWDQAARQVVQSLPPDWQFDFRLHTQFPFWRRMAALEPGDAYRPFEPATWHIGGVFELLGALILLNLGISLLMAIYLQALADGVQGGTPALVSPVGHVMRAWLSMLVIMVMMTVLLTVVGLPVVIIVALVVQLAPALGSFLFAIFGALVLWLAFGASFAYDAIVLRGDGPIEALLASMRLIRRWFWGALGLYLLATFIQSGLGFIWQTMTGSTLGMLVAIVASAYIGAGLATAHLVFFQDRYRPSPARPQPQ